MFTTVLWVEARGIDYDHHLNNLMSALNWYKRLNISRFLPPVAAPNYVRIVRLMDSIFNRFLEISPGSGLRQVTGDKCLTDNREQVLFDLKVTSVLGQKPCSMLFVFI